MDDEPRRPNSTIFVANLDPTHVTTSTLSEVFIPFGEILDVTLPKPEAPSSTDLHRGFGYVEFEDANDAKEAIDNMDQSELYGRVIKVAMAKPDVKRDQGQPGLGSTIAIWEQEGYLNKYGGGQGDVDRAVVGQDDRNGGEEGEDPMQGLEELDVAGPRRA
ncbi:hypothetical protein LTS08_007776 [Lithohypha guttulata]|nr:hypothetical protein LTS08_007776 [Lithohypha guttulata]